MPLDFKIIFSASNVKKTGAFIAGAVVLDMAVAAAQYPFIERGCPTFRNATIGNLMATFANIAAPVYRMNKENLSSRTNEIYQKISQESPDKIDKCYGWLPSTYLVKYTK